MRRERGGSKGGPEAVAWFEAGETNRGIAVVLRGSERSVEQWPLAWREGGAAGVAAQGSPGGPRLSGTQLARFEQELKRGPLVHGWADQWWTLARIKPVIGRSFHVSHTVEGTWRLLRQRLDVAAAGPAGDRARRGSGGGVGAGGVAAGESIAAERDARVVFEDQAGQSIIPPPARSWGRRDCTPVVRVRGRGPGRVSVAGLTCSKARERSPLFCPVRGYRDRKGEPKGIGWRDPRDLLVRAHIQLGGSIVLVWGNLRLHPADPLRTSSPRTSTGSPSFTSPAMHLT